MPKQRARAIALATWPVAFRPSTAREIDRTIDVTWRAGRRWPLERPGDDFEEELLVSRARVNFCVLDSGMALVLSGRPGPASERAIGVVRRAYAKENDCFATLRLSPRDEVTPIWSAVRSGAVRHAAVLYRLYGFEMQASPGRPDLRRITAWQPIKVIVPDRRVLQSSQRTDNAQP